MTLLSEHNSLQFVKGLVLGHPGSGKTGGLTSLVKAGYKLRIYDFDNLLGSLVQYVKFKCPDKISNVSYQTFTDKMQGLEVPMVMMGGAPKVLPFVNGVPDAYVRGLKQLNHWKTADEDLGKPATWGRDTIIVIDSLTSVSESAFRYVQMMNLAGKDPRQDYGAAQNLIKNMIQLLASEAVQTHVLVLAHITYRENELEIVRGFPRTMGAALNDVIAAYFNCVLMVETLGDGPKIKRQIRTNSSGIVDLKNPVSFKVDDVLPLETGLADFFQAVTSYQPSTLKESQVA